MLYISELGTQIIDTDDKISTAQDFHRYLLMTSFNPISFSDYQQNLNMYYLSLSLFPTGNTR